MPSSQRNDCRWLFARTLSLAVSLICFPAFLAIADEQTSGSHPNVLLIITDDQGYGDLGSHGNQQLKTPRLDGLAAQSIRFNRFLVNPLCAPTRAALLTGRYSIRTGAVGVQGGLETMHSEEVTLGEIFKSDGYSTGYFGKWHNGEHHRYSPLGQGFDEFLGFQLGHWNNYFNTKLKHNEEWVSSKGFIADVFTDAATQFIREVQPRPWFCYLAYNTPHWPAQCPDSYFDRYKQLGLSDEDAAAYGMVSNLDDNIGRVLDELDRSHQAQNTIVIFLTDNGPNGNRFNGGLKARKGSYYEGGIHVPCFIRWPAKFNTPRVIAETAAHIDLFPTLVELCGLKHQPKDDRLLDGRSLVPLLISDKDEAPKDWNERMIFIKNEPRPVQLEPKAGAKGTLKATGSIHWRNWHAVNVGKGWELYDLKLDPSEKQDLTKQNAPVMNRLQTDFDGWWRSVSRESRSTRPPIPVDRPIGKAIELPVPQSELLGGVKFSGRHPNNAWAIDFIGPQAELRWELDVEAPGRYAVSVEYLCTEPMDSKLMIEQGEQTLAVALPKTERVQVPSPDRFSRTEVYELEWSNLDVGELQLEEGRQTLRVKLSVPNPSFELKSVTLKRK